MCVFQSRGVTIIFLLLENHGKMVILICVARAEKQLSSAEVPTSVKWQNICWCWWWNQYQQWCTLIGWKANVSRRKVDGDYFSLWFSQWKGIAIYSVQCQQSWIIWLNSTKSRISPIVLQALLTNHSGAYTYIQGRVVPRAIRIAKFGIPQWSPICRKLSISSAFQSLKKLLKNHS